MERRIQTKHRLNTRKCKFGFLPIEFIEKDRSLRKLLQGGALDIHCITHFIFRGHCMFVKLLLTYKASGTVKFCK